MKMELEKAMKLVTKSFTAEKKKVKAGQRLSYSGYCSVVSEKTLTHRSIKRACWKYMEQAYMKASADNTLPANARQIMYAIRPLVIEETGNEDPFPKGGVLFTGNYLKEYLREEQPNWDVVFDARGTFIEPHTRHKIPVGTLGIRNYIQAWTNGEIVCDLPSPNIQIDTTGPSLRYSGVLFIEKEGFHPLLEKAKIADKYDLAIMSTKGISSDAGCDIVDTLVGKGLKVYIARDFDKAGFVIAGKLMLEKSGDCYWGREVELKSENIIDLGLRLSDVEEMELQSEPVRHPGQKDPLENLRENGATEDEINFLSEYTGWHYKGKRVELNAMSSDQFIDWIERKLAEHGHERIMPNDEQLEKAYNRALVMRKVEKMLDEYEEQYDEESKRPLPKGFRLKLENWLKTSTQSWDLAVYNLACEKNGSQVK